MCFYRNRKSTTRAVGNEVFDRANNHFWHFHIESQTDVGRRKILFHFVWRVKAFLCPIQKKCSALLLESSSCLLNSPQASYWSVSPWVMDWISRISNVKPLWCFTDSISFQNHTIKRAHKNEHSESLFNKIIACAQCAIFSPRTKSLLGSWEAPGAAIALWGPGLLTHCCSSEQWSRMGPLSLSRICLLLSNTSY